MATTLTRWRPFESFGELIDATYKDGVLEVTIPTAEARKAVPIKIKAKAA
jgi:HSP20 family molecular chaperone IbpA